MKSIRSLWWLGVVAAVAACDPYDPEVGGQPKVLSVFASGGNSNDGVLAEEDATGGGTDPWDVTSTSVCTAAVPDDPATADDESVPQRVKPDAGVIFVKVNKLLDGASIQTTPDSCVPANSWLTVTRDGVPDAAAWFTCYNPSTATSAEGSSIVIYRGENISPGFSGNLWLDQANDAGTTTAVVDYALTGQVKDKQGNLVDINITFHVEPDAGSVGDVVVDTTAKTITWELAECDGGLAATGGYHLYKQDATDDAPVSLTEQPAGTTSFTDPDMTDTREYFIAPIIANVGGQPYETSQQGPFDTTTNPTP
ncbi:MAG TPA: hypothetical protein VLC54_04275 [Anaeromyxobacter sp.]|nr:hypothetical protein [Anaeromyxobacter sp.]